MQLRIALILIACFVLNGCATMRRHPVVTGIIVGAGIGIGVGLATRGHGHCPNTYENRPYSGTPPCPIEDGK
jgi:hypothetical protein